MKFQIKSNLLQKLINNQLSNKLFQKAIDNKINKINKIFKKTKIISKSLLIK